MQYFVFGAVIFVSYFITQFIQLGCLSDIVDQAKDYAPEGVNKFHVAGMWAILGLGAMFGYLLIH